MSVIVKKLAGNKVKFTDSITMESVIYDASSLVVSHNDTDKIQILSTQNASYSTRPEQVVFGFTTALLNKSACTPPITGSTVAEIAEELASVHFANGSSGGSGGGSVTATGVEYTSKTVSINAGDDYINTNFLDSADFRELLVYNMTDKELFITGLYVNVLIVPPMSTAAINNLKNASETQPKFSGDYEFRIDEILANDGKIIVSIKDYTY